MHIKLFYGATEVGVYDTVTKSYILYPGMEEGLIREVRELIKYIQPLYEYGLPEGDCLQMCQNHYIGELQKGEFPWLPASFNLYTGSSDLSDYMPVPENLKSGTLLSTDIPGEMFMPENAYSRGVMSSFPGHKDKFPGQIIPKNDTYIVTSTAKSKEIGNIIIKPQDPKYPFICENEFICMQMAERVGIRVPRSWLIRDSNGKFQYCVERFGIYRDSNGKVFRENIVDFLGILNMRSRDKYCVTLNELFECALRYLTGCDFNEFVRMWYYGYIIGNTDMHPKNFSLFLRDTEKCKLAPAYDMVHMLCYGAENHSCLKEMGKTRYSTNKEILSFLKSYIIKNELEEIDSAVYINASPIINNVFKLHDKYNKHDNRTKAKIIQMQTKMLEHFTVN